MKQIPISLVLAFCVFQTGCNSSERSDHVVALTNDPKIQIGMRDASHPASLLVWYVETDGAGHNGYACVYSTLGVPNPGGKGLFRSLKVLQDAIHIDQHSAMPIETGFRGVVPTGWRIRNLSEAELNTLRAKTAPAGVDHAVER
jgi:hypothetical protein